MISKINKIIEMIEIVKLNIRELKIFIIFREGVKFYYLFKKV